MVEKKEFSFESRSGNKKVYAVRWMPEGQPVAVVQIVHGMQEYMGRYEQMAEYFAENGFIVTGEDHLGHGKSVDEQAGDVYGYFCKYDSENVLVRNVHRLKKITQADYPGVPYFILGHSFGSYILREYIQRYGTGIAGAIIQGGGVQKESTVNLALVLAHCIKFIHSDKYRSPMINNIAFGHYQDNMENPKTSYEWLSHNRESIDAYAADKACNFMFTLNGFITLGHMIKDTQNKKNMALIPENLPILLTAGAEDPVGGYGESVKALNNIYVNELGLKNVSMKVYEGMRHEIHNENGRQEVFDDYNNWMKTIIKTVNYKKTEKEGNNI